LWRAAARDKKTVVHSAAQMVAMTAVLLVELSALQKAEKSVEHLVCLRVVVKATPTVAGWVVKSAQLKVDGCAEGSSAGWVVGCEVGY